MSIEKDGFLDGMKVSSLILHQPDDINLLLNLYNITLRDLVDNYAHLRIKKMHKRHLLLWQYQDKQVAKRDTVYSTTVDQD